jgi:hypothetical protein
MRHIREALALDPLAGPFNRSFDIITQHIRAELLPPDRPANDAGTPRLYQLLIEAGATEDEEPHLAMARYLLSTGDRVADLRLTEAVATLFPLSSRAWVLRAEVAVAMGDPEAAAVAKAQAAALGEGPVPFAVPGQAQG